MPGKLIAVKTSSKKRKSVSILRVGLVQTRVTTDIDRNLATTARFIREAARRGAEIVCLQELFANRYFAQSENSDAFALAETIPGLTSRFLASAAKENRVTLVGGSVYEQASDGRRFNTTLIYDVRGKLTGKYRKMHIPQDPNYYEQYYFRQGDLGYVQVPTPKAVVAPLICYDQWFPEAARANAIRGADVLFYPTAIGWFRDLRQDEPYSARRWEDAMRSHASMNGIFVAAVNRVGREGDLRFWGGSFIADPFGQIVIRASRSKEEVVMADIDLEKISISQEGWGFLANRRPDSYRDLIE